ncbi:MULTISPECIES: hypothetical protein [unclassified Mameliella]|uniref:hypothetical protein n=1 Tax=unclassified Mameliella TaxID=2630630 RepID=UPI00273D2679|nr:MULTISPECIES: hypothetical protein [unclassified Mameliella]
MSIFGEKKLQVCALAVMKVLAGAVVQAEEIRPGCYTRFYSDAHLRDQPAQVVRAVRLWVGPWMTEVAREARIEVVPANQGHARGAPWVGARLQQFLICGTESGAPICQVECDGGRMEVTKQDAQGMVFRTRYMVVGNTGECGGVMDMAEVQGQWVSYRLYRTDDSNCTGM